MILQVSKKVDFSACKRTAGNLARTSGKSHYVVPLITGAHVVTDVAPDPAACTRWYECDAAGRFIPHLTEAGAEILMDRMGVAR